MFAGLPYKDQPFAGTPAPAAPPEAAPASGCVTCGGTGEVGGSGPPNPEPPERCPTCNPASGWKAREWTGDDLNGLPDGIGTRAKSVVERRPEAREWWRCDDCGRTYEKRPTYRHQDKTDSGYCAEVGWSRVMTIERVEAAMRFHADSPAALTLLHFADLLKRVNDDPNANLTIGDKEQIAAALEAFEGKP